MTYDEANDFLVFRDSIAYDTLGITELKKGIDFENASDEMIKLGASLFLEELDRRGNDIKELLEKHREKGGKKNEQ